MRRKRKKWWLLPIFALSLAALIYFILNVNPNTPIKLSVINYSFSAILPFFLLIFLVICSLFAFILNNLRRGVFVGVFTIGFLALRYYHLDQFLFFILLTAILVALELFFTSRK